MGDEGEYLDSLFVVQIRHKNPPKWRDLGGWWTKGERK
jgi:hypothetical protein